MISNALICLPIVSHACLRTLPTRLNFKIVSRSFSTELSAEKLARILRRKYIRVYDLRVFPDSLNALLTTNAASIRVLGLPLQRDCTERIRSHGFSVLQMVAFAEELL